MNNLKFRDTNCKISNPDSKR